MNAVSLNNLWSYLQGLSLTASNQRWLGERLIEASTAAKATSADIEVATPHQHRVHKSRKALSDEQLAECLAQYAPLTDADFPNLSKEDYALFARNNGGRITKGLEKWL